MKKDPEHLAKRLGVQIAAQRRACKLTQDELAEKLGIAGETVSRIERGATLPSLATLQKLSQVLRVRISDLLSEGSNELGDQVEVLLRWMSPLSSAQRTFVMDQVKLSCAFLKATKG